MTTLDFSGLAARPSQVWNGVRLVPLVRDAPVADLRLRSQLVDDVSIVQVGPRDVYVSYIPHGFVATWTDDGAPAAAYGTQLSGDESPPADTMGLRFLHRMARRQAKDRLRFIPLHLALDGYLALHFGGPAIAWSEWSRRAIRQGLSPRAEEAYLGFEVRGLSDALRVFEIHPGQCGALLYVADALAAAFVVPHPDDYRALHPTLVTDLYGELIHHYATFMPPVPDFRARIPDAPIRSLDDLRAAVSEQESAWTHFHDTAMAAALRTQEFDWQTVYRLGRFTLSRFLPRFRLDQDNHIGEAITDETGALVYLKTFRLSRNQVRRGYLLSRFAANEWNVPGTAADLGIDPERLGRRLEAAGLDFLLRQDILDGYRKRLRHT